MRIGSKHRAPGDGGHDTARGADSAGIAGRGLIIAMFQAATQINEMTLSFVPKLMVVAVVMMSAGPWMLRQITGFMQRLVENIPT